MKIQLTFKKKDIRTAGVQRNSMNCTFTGEECFPSDSAGIPARILPDTAEVLLPGEGKNRYVGIRYTATGIGGHSFEQDGREVFSVSHLVVPNPDIRLSGFGVELVHRRFKEETLIPGHTVREVTEKNGDIYGSYLCLSLSRFRLTCGAETLDVLSGRDGWQLLRGTEPAGGILRLEESKRRHYCEGGYEKETLYEIVVGDVPAELLPLIFGVPMLGF